MLADHPRTQAARVPPDDARARTSVAVLLSAKAQPRSTTNESAPANTVGPRRSSSCHRSPSCLVGDQADRHRAARLSNPRAYAPP